MKSAIKTHLGGRGLYPLWLLVKLSPQRLPGVMSTTYKLSFQSFFLYLESPEVDRYGKAHLLPAESPLRCLVSSLIAVAGNSMEAFHKPNSRDTFPVRQPAVLNPFLPRHPP
jgi:hypothetical protein